MTSDISFILKFTHTYDQSLIESTPENGTLPHRLLSPIVENSAENSSISVPNNRTCLETQNSILSNKNFTIDELHQRFLSKIHQYISNLENIENYLNKLEQHFQALTLIIQYLRNDVNFTEIIELLESRLLLMRAKRNQLNDLLNQTSFKNLIQQILPFLHQSNLFIDYSKFLNSIQLSLNQKTVLIDHINNEYRYRKYQVSEYSSKLHQQHDLLIQLSEQLEQYRTQHEKLIQKDNHISICNEDNHQSLEFINLSNEYEQLHNENYLLTLQAKENLQRLSLFTRSN